MTLFIKLITFSQFAESGFLFVQTQKSGILTTKKISSGTTEGQKYLVMCANDDNLQFKFCKTQEQYKNGNYLSTTQLYAPVLIKKSSHLLGLDNEFQFPLELMSRQNQSKGTIICSITYDRVSHYQGQFSISPDKNIIKPITTGFKRVQMFKGKCKTKNLFSMIDSAAQGQQMKFIESIYKDQEI